MRTAAIIILVLLLILIGLQLAAPSIYQECVSPDGHFDTLQVALYKLNNSGTFQGLAYLLAGLLGVILFVLIFRKHTLNKIKKGIILAVVAVFTLVTVSLGFLFLAFDTVTGYGASAVRNSFIGTARAHFELYYDENGRYPTTLLDALPDSWKKSAFDPVTGKPYGYAVSEDGHAYVLSVTFGAMKDSSCLEPVSSLRRLEDDLDGTVFGLECDDPIYCTGYSMKDGKLVELE